MAIFGKLGDGLARYAPNTETFLVGGTYSMAHSEPLEGQNVSCNYIHFSNPQVADTPPDLLNVGSLNPSALVPGNQIVILVARRTGYKPFVVGCWVPDGAAGRYAVEQNPEFFHVWYGYGGAAYKAVWLFWLAALSRIFLWGFIFRKATQKALDAHPFLGNPTPGAHMQNWAAHIMQRGRFQEEYKNAFGASGGPMIGDSGENAFM